MNREEAKKRIDTLRETLRYHAQLYYQKDAPEITDDEYDALFRELTVLEEEFPEFADPTSPTVRVGVRLLNALRRSHTACVWEV